MKNWQSYFLALLVPILAVLINVVMAQSAISIINVGVVSNNSEISNLIQTGLNLSDQLEIKAISFENFNKAMSQLKVNKIGLIVRLTDGKDITLYYDDSRQESQIAVQYLINSIQSYISVDLTNNYPQEVTDLIKHQKFIIKPIQNINKSVSQNKNVNTMVLFGMMWIFIFFHLIYPCLKYYLKKIRGRCIICLKYICLNYG